MVRNGIDGNLGGKKWDRVAKNGREWGKPPF